jgi:hypothetical protein
VDEEGELLQRAYRIAEKLHKDGLDGAHAISVLGLALGMTLARYEWKGDVKKMVGSVVEDAVEAYRLLQTGEEPNG